MEQEERLNKLRRYLTNLGLTQDIIAKRFLGLNMIEPLKPLIDSGLAVFLLSVSNKTAPKPMKNAPIFGRGGSK